MKFRRIAPMLGVTNMEASSEFWTNLGFEVGFTNGDPTCFAILRKDDVEIHLKVDPDRAGGAHCHILMEGLEEFQNQFTGRVLQPMREQSWGLRDMVVSDPDGNTIEMAERLRAKSDSA